MNVYLAVAWRIGSTATTLHRCMPQLQGKKGAVCCQGCKKFQFCSHECHLAEWPRHKTECKMLRKMALEETPSTIALE